MKKTKQARPAKGGVSVRIEEGLRDRAKVLSAQRKTTILAVLNTAVEGYLKRFGA
jgi:hypothetical protein